MGARSYSTRSRSVDERDPRGVAMTQEDGSAGRPGGQATTDLAAALGRSVVLAAVAPPDVRAAPHVEALGQSHGLMTRGVYRVAGAARDREQPRTWSAILKILSPEALPSAGRDDPASWMYWRREVLAYECGLLEDLPGGLRAPRLLGREDQPDGSVWLWLEEVHDAHGPRWPLAQYRRAARCLGRFNGAYLAGHPPPPYPWLHRMSSPRGLLDNYAWLRDVVAAPATWQHPSLRARAAELAPRLLRLWDERAPLLDLLEGLPQTLCHVDAWRGNLYAPAGAATPEEIIAIDWAVVGWGSVGTDAGDLFAPSFAHGLVEPCTPHDLDEAVFESYFAGLHEAGWRPDRALVRFGYAAFAALKYGGVLPWLFILGEAGAIEAWAQGAGRPLEEMLHEPIAWMAYLLDLLDEARDLAARC
jgi:hypothetical protein